MRPLLCAALAAPLLLLPALLACDREDAPSDRVVGYDVPEASLFAPLPAAMESPANARTPEKVALGRMLFYDTRFSADQGVSCYVCHPLHDYGTSHRVTGVGRDHMPAGRNEPTVYNAAGHIAQFWDGRAADVEAQALGPVLATPEMGMPDASAVIDRIRSIPGYVAAFERAFPDEAEPVTFDNFGRAIGAFERGLVTPSRWDAYLAGDANALTDEEKDGLRTFVAAGCAQCHAGAYVGGTTYQRVGLQRPWPNQADPGRFAITGKEDDRMVFKVASLRNVEETWPYFHDGSVRRLDDAIALMAAHQTGRELSATQIASIRGWLHTLTGPVPLDYIEEPDLPADPATGVDARLTRR